MTFDEYLAYDDGTDTQYELVDGELVEMPPESEENADLARFLHVELNQHFPFYWVGHKDTEIEVSGRLARCRLPDLIVHTEESKAALVGTERATITRDMPPPALVIEIVSLGSSNRTRDYRYKRTEYAARGIAEYWIVDPEARQVTLCKWVDGAYDDTIVQESTLIHSDIVPDLKLSVDRLFTMER